MTNLLKTKDIKEVFRPYTRELDFDINMNNKGLISITTNNYYYKHGDHYQIRNDSVRKTIISQISAKGQTWQAHVSLHVLYQKANTMRDCRLQQSRSKTELQS